MKITNYELVNIKNLLDACENKSFPQQIMYLIFKNEKVIADDVEIYNKSLNKLLEKYHPYFIMDNESKDVKYMPSGLPEVEEGMREEYLKEINELISLEIDVDFYQVEDYVFNYDDFGYDTFPISLMKIFSLD